jgi:hypothetical protein
LIAAQALFLLIPQQTSELEFQKWENALSVVEVLNSSRQQKENHPTAMLHTEGNPQPSYKTKGEPEKSEVCRCLECGKIFKMTDDEFEISEL